MTDDYREFLALDETAYDEDRPGDQILLRRVRRQVGSVLEYPRGLTRGERLKNSAVAYPLYAAAPRVLSYQPRRIPAGLGRFRVTVPVGGRQFDQFEDSGLVVGRIEVRFRAGSTKGRSGWVTVNETPVGEARIYELDVTFPAFSEDAYGEIWLVGQSEPVEQIGTRQMTDTPEGVGRVFQAAPSTPVDPYPEGTGFYDPENDRYVDLFETFAEPAPGNDQVFRYSPPTYMSENVEVWRFAGLEIPDGMEVRPQWDGVNEVADESLYAGRRPKFTPGPGELKRGIQRELSYWWPSASGPEHEDTDAFAGDWNRPQRIPMDGTIKNTSTDYNPRVVFRPRAADVDVQILAGMFAFTPAGDPVELDYYAEVGDPGVLYGADTFTWAFSNCSPDNARPDATLAYHYDQVWVNSNDYEYTYTNGLPFAGWGDQQTANSPVTGAGEVPLGDMPLVNLQTATIEVRGAPINAPLYLSVERQTEQDTGAIMWLGLTVHQTVPDLT